MALILSGDSPSISGTYQGGVLTNGTTQASTSGTSIDFTSIPSWVKRVTILFNGTSTNGTSIPQVQLGTAGGIVSTGYTACAGADGAKNTITSGVPLFGYSGVATATIYGRVVFSTLGSNIWVVSGVTNRVTAEPNSFIAGGITLSDTLTTLRITTVNGTDAFDAGSINIQYE